MTQEPTSKSIQSIDRGAGSLVSGAAYPLQALRLLLTSPQLRRYVLMPILLNLVLGVTLYTGLLFAGFRAIDSLIATLPTLAAEVPHWTGDMPSWTISLPVWAAHLFDWTANLPHWSLPLPHWNIALPNITLPGWVANLPNWGLLVLLGLVRLLLVIVLLLVTGFILLQFGVLIGAPWYGKLSEELEKMQTGQLQTIEISPIQEIGRAVQYELKKLVLTLGVGLPLLLFNFFPGIGTAIATAGGLILAATLVCLDFLDSALERRRLRFRQKLGVIRQSLPASATFGLVCLGLVSIPFFNLLAIPVCVTAGTLFFCDRIFPWLQVSRGAKDSGEMTSP
jgi:CysZ protein